MPDALDYYDELQASAGARSSTSAPYGDARARAFSFDYSFNYYPLDYERPGPEITIYRIC